MEIQTAIEIVECGGIAASVLGAGVVGALATYRRIYGARESTADPDAHYFDLSRKFEALTGRVELLETSIRHLATSQDIVALIRTVHEVDRRLAKIEGFVMGKQGLAD